jgi:hypothetical protein
VNAGIEVFESLWKKRVYEAVYDVVSGICGHWFAVVDEV